MTSHARLLAFMVIGAVLSTACGSSNESERGSGSQTSFSDAGQSIETSDETPDEIPDETPDVGETDAEELSVPVFAEGSDLARIVGALERVIGATLVGLNESVSTGELLSEREQACLGSFEPGAGQPLLGVDCPDARLRTADFPIVITMASFADTEACRADLFIGQFSACRLQRANLSLETVFEVPERVDDDDFTPQRPVPVPGADIILDPDNANALILTDDQAGLTSGFDCAYDLRTGELDSANRSVRCAEETRRIADRLDTLAPVL